MSPTAGVDRGARRRRRRDRIVAGERRSAGSPPRRRPTSRRRAQRGQRQRRHARREPSALRVSPSPSSDLRRAASGSRLRPLVTSRRATFVMRSPRGYHPEKGTTFCPSSDLPRHDRDGRCTHPLRCDRRRRRPRRHLRRARTRAPRRRHSVLVVERGPDIARRACPARKTGVCAGCEPCDITCGWGGAGAFSDGKLTLTTEVGGWLDRFVAKERLTRAHRLRRRHLARVRRDRTRCTAAARRPSKIRRQALLHGMTLVAVAGAPHGHRALLRHPHAHARGAGGARRGASPASRVERILTEKPAGESDLRATGVVLEDGTRLTADAVIAAPGPRRRRAGWSEECKRLHIELRTNPVDIGVRVEVLGGGHGAAHRARSTRASSSTTRRASTTRCAPSA